MTLPGKTRNQTWTTWISLTVVAHVGFMPHLSSPGRSSFSSAVWKIQEVLESRGDSRKKEFSEPTDIFSHICKDQDRNSTVLTLEPFVLKTILLAII